VCIQPGKSGNVGGRGDVGGEDAAGPKTEVSKERRKVRCEELCDVRLDETMVSGRDI